MALLKISAFSSDGRWLVFPLLPIFAFFKSISIKPFPLERKSAFCICTGPSRLAISDSPISSLIDMSFLMLIHESVRNHRRLITLKVVIDLRSFQWLLYTALGGSVLADGLITISLCILLGQQRTGFKSYAIFLSLITSTNTINSGRIHLLLP